MSKAGQPLFVGQLSTPGSHLIVGRFEGSGQTLRPVLKDCTQPLRMRRRLGEHTAASLAATRAAASGDPAAIAAAAAAEDGRRIIEIADSQGRNALVGTKEKLESHYIAITKEVGPDGKAQYYAHPVDEWYTFTAVSDLHSMSAAERAQAAEEEVETQERLLRFGDRPSAAALLLKKKDDDEFRKGNIDLSAAARMEATTGDIYGGGDDIGSSNSVNDQRGGAAAAGLGSKASRGLFADGAMHDGLGRIGELAADDIDGAIAALEGNGRGGGGGGRGGGGAMMMMDDDDDMGGGGGGRRNGGGGGGDYDDGGGADGRIFEAFGGDDAAGGGGDDGGVDLDIMFDDDAGDAGNDADFAGQVQFGAEEEAADGGGGGEMAAEDEDEDGEGGGGGVDVEGEELQDAGSVNKRYAALLAKQKEEKEAAAAAAASGGAGGEGGDKDGAADASGKRKRSAMEGAGGADGQDDGEEDDEGFAGVGAGRGAGSAGEPLSKRPRLDRYVDPITALRDRLRRLMVAHGGRITMNIVSKEFAAELKASPDDFKQTLMNVMKALFRQVVAADGSTKQYVFKENVGGTGGAGAAR